MNRKSKGHLTMTNTRQVYNCKVTDFQSDLQEGGAKCMNVVLREVGRIPACSRSGELSLLHIIGKAKGGSR